MKVLLLGAGYGTRLAKDLEHSKDFHHLIGIAKPLLPIGGKPLISHWLELLEKLKEIDEIYVVTNKVNHGSFEEWSQNWPKVQLLCDNSTSNETRTGAVGCMNLAINSFQIKDDLIVIAGDTLFYEDFNLTHYIQKFHSLCTQEPEASLLVYVNCKEEEVHKYGILETDACGRVVGFLEKPDPQQTTSRKQCPCFYFLNHSVLSQLDQFLVDTQDGDFKARDATGNFIAYLYPRAPVFAEEISGRFDVGGLSSYIFCDEYFTSQKKVT